MKEKKYTFFESYHRALSRVSDERYGRVVRAMSNYVFESQEPDFADDGDWIVWELVKPILDGMTNHNSSDNLLTVEEVSNKFKVNRITVWRWADASTMQQPILRRSSTSSNIHKSRITI